MPRLAANEFQVMRMALDDDYDNRISAQPLHIGPQSDIDFSLPVPVPHSGFGVASFVIALVTGIGAFFSIAIAAFLGIKNGPIPKNDPTAVLIGLVIIGSGVLSLIGLVLGIVGVCQSNRRVVFAMLGTVLNVFIILGICGVVGLGFAMGGH